MSTVQYPVALGTPVIVTAGDNTDFVAAPGAGGTVTLEASVDGINYFGGVTSGTGQVISLNSKTLGLGAFAKVRATAATAAAALFACDIAAPFRAGGNQSPIIAQTSLAISSPNATTEGNIWAMRFPAGYFKPNWSLECDLMLGATNNANVKTIKAYFGNTGVATVLATQVTTSSSGGRMTLRLAGRNDGQTVLSSSIGSALGYGISTTAVVLVTTLANYLAQEQELVITSTKATGTDTSSLESILVSLYQ